MKDFIKNVFGIYDENSVVNKFHFDYRNSIFSKIIIPIMAFILLIHNDNKLISRSYNIYSQKKTLYGLMPSVISKIVEFILTYVNIFGKFVYSNYCLIICLLLGLFFLIQFVGKRGCFRKFEMYNSKMMDKKGRIHGFDYISACSNIIDIIIFTMTDLWIIYSFSSIFLWNINTISKHPYLSGFLNFVYAIKLSINFIFKLFSITYDENYYNLNFNSLRELDSEINNRFGVLNHKKIENSDRNLSPSLENKHVYILKDRFRNESTFLCVMIDEYDNKKLITNKVHYSTNLEEIQIVFDYMTKEYS